MERRPLTVIVAFAALGIALSGYSLAHHFSLVPGTLCDINATFSCDLVNKSDYSEISGVPVALIGIVGYALILAAALARMRQPNDGALRAFLTACSLGAVAFSLYLTGVEAFVLHAYCPVCLLSLACIVTIAAATSRLWKTRGA